MLALEIYQCVIFLFNEGEVMKFFAFFNLFDYIFAEIIKEFLTSNSIFWYILRPILCYIFSFLAIIKFLI